MAAISFNMITKDCPEPFFNALRSVYDTLYEEGDEVVVVDTGSSPENLEALEKGLQDFVGARLILRPDLRKEILPWVEKWLPEYASREQVKEYFANGGVLNFSEARQVALEASTKEIIFWLDSDDIVREAEPGQIRKALTELMGGDEPRVDALFLDYDYAWDPADGAITTTLRRERFFFRERFEWRGRCHETAVPLRPDQSRGVAYLANVDASIFHTEHRKPGQLSDIRNYVLLRKELEESEVPDPRTVFYLGNSARGLRRWREALKLYDDFDRLSGSPDDRYAASYYRAAISLEEEVQRPLAAIDAYTKCIQILPGDPRGYFGLARAYATMQRWQECLYWYGLGLQHRLPENQVFSYDPTHVTYHPHVLAAHAAKEKGDMVTFKECAARAFQARPKHPITKELKKSAEAIVESNELKRSFGVILRNLKHGGPNARRVAAEVASELIFVPPELEKIGVSAPESPDPRESRPEMAILCGEAGEDWGPRSRLTGIGGSEKMVILLSEALQRLGAWNVSVYTNVPSNQRGIDRDTGVNWQHWSTLDQKRPRDVLVAWRSPNLLEMPCPARLRVLWNHDVQQPATYTKKVLALADYVQCQSQFHAEPIRDVVGDKLWVSRNAIEWYADKPVPQRNPARVLYCSCPTRGLTTAARVVAKAQETDPEIELVVAYGFSPYARKAFAANQHRYIPDMGHDMSVDLYEREVYKWLDRVGAKMLQRVGWEELFRWMLGSGVWLYPTRFPEISCMAAMEAQCAGMTPIATDYGALAETVLECEPLPALPERGEVPQHWVDAAAKRLVSSVHYPYTPDFRVRQAKKAWERFNIDALAQDWIDRLK